MNKKFLVIYLLIVLLQRSYVSLLPSLPVYPNSYQESFLVLKEMKKDKSLFYKTDLSVGTAFVGIVPETPEAIDKILVSHNVIITLFKYIINRPRPEQVNKDIIPRTSKTANTPSYPSGHTYQAFLLAHILSKKYPHLREKLLSIAEECGQARIRAGLHYPSDHDFSKRLVQIFEPL